MTPNPKPHLPPKSIEELLDHEELLAFRTGTASARKLGQDLLAASGLRGGIRKRPLVAAAAATGLGLLGGSVLLRAIPRLAGAVAKGGAKVGGNSRLLAAAAVVTLRLLRTRRQEAD